MGMWNSHITSHIALSVWDIPRLQGTDADLFDPDNYGVYGVDIGACPGFPSWMSPVRVRYPALDNPSESKGFFRLHLS